jgi:hypothetical protein
MQAAIERNSAMYQIYLRVHASKLALRATRIQRRAAAQPRRQVFGPRAVLAGLAQLAALRVLSDPCVDRAEQHDPRNPRNW